MSADHRNSRTSLFLLSSTIAMAIAILAAILLPTLFDPTGNTGSASILSEDGKISWEASGKLAGFILVFFSLVVAILKFADYLGKR